jgi:hypothetical protein
MTSTAFTDLLEKTNEQALKMPSKKKKINPEKRKQNYIVNKKDILKIKEEVDKIINPISQEILNKVIKLPKRKYRITVKSNFDNKKYLIEITIPKR